MMGFLEIIFQSSIKCPVLKWSNSTRIIQWKPIFIFNSVDDQSSKLDQLDGSTTHYKTPYSLGKKFVHLTINHTDPPLMQKQAKLCSSWPFQAKIAFCLPPNFLWVKQD